jgi:hypothetical protein
VLADTSYRDAECELDTLDRLCSEDPQGISLLRALANFSNNLQRLRRMVTEQSNFFDGRAAGLPDLFNPQDESVEEANEALENFGTALSVGRRLTWRSFC